MAGYSDMDERRRRLLESLSGSQGTNGGRLMGAPRKAMPLYGGTGHGHGGDYAPAPLPSLSFNPFLAQQRMGIPGLAGPSNASDMAPGHPVNPGGQAGAPGLDAGPPGQSISDANGAPVGAPPPLQNGYAAPGGAGRILMDRAPGSNSQPQVDPASLLGGDQYPGAADTTNPFLLHFLRYQASFGGDA